MYRLQAANAGSSRSAANLDREKFFDYVLLENIYTAG